MTEPKPHDSEIRPVGYSGLFRTVCLELECDYDKTFPDRPSAQQAQADHRHDTRYPEHAKLALIKDKSQTIGKFLDHSGYHLAYPNGDLVAKPIERILAQWFEIDLAKIDLEKRAMLAEIRRANKEGDPGGDW